MSHTLNLTAGTPHRGGRPLAYVGLHLATLSRVESLRFSRHEGKLNGFSRSTECPDGRTGSGTVAYST
jgi:hypothetical protein